MASLALQRATRFPFKSYAFPKRWALPGFTQPQPSAQALNGCRANIVHALTYYGLPPQIDEKIEQLPPGTVLRNLGPAKQEFLSFSVYSLKQMTAGRTISPQTAWSLFNLSYHQLPSVTSDSFAVCQEAFIRQAAEAAGLTVNGPDLLEIEFWLRAGEDGLSQFEQFHQWSEQLVMKRVPDHLKDSYRKALWLEMRIIEAQAGLGKMNDDIKVFTLSDEGQYFGSTNEVRSAITLFNPAISSQFADAIDSSIKAEVGHWYFDCFCVLTNFMSEVADRTNIAGYTPDIALSTYMAKEEMSPMMRAFREGGYYLTSSRQPFPSFPEQFFTQTAANIEGRSLFYVEKHIIAEYLEWRLRQLLAAKKIKSDDVYSTYRQFTLYINILYLENLGNKNLEEIIRAAFQEINPAIVKQYCQEWRERTIAAYHKIIAQRLCHAGGRVNAVRNIYKLAGAGSLPTLQLALKDPNYDVRLVAADASLKIRSFAADLDEEKTLAAYRLVCGAEWESLAAMGRAALPALRAALADEEDYIRDNAKRVLQAIEASSAA